MEYPQIDSPVVAPTFRFQRNKSISQHYPDSNREFRSLTEILYRQTITELMITFLAQVHCNIEEDKDSINLPKAKLTHWLTNDLLKRLQSHRTYHLNQSSGD